MKNNKITYGEWADNLEAMSSESQREFCDCAVTVMDLAEKWGMSENTCRRRAKVKVLGGQWRKVWKKINGRPTPAYLPVKK